MWVFMYIIHSKRSNETQPILSVKDDFIVQHLIQGFPNLFCRKDTAQPPVKSPCEIFRVNAVIRSSVGGGDGQDGAF